LGPVELHRDHLPSALIVPALSPVRIAISFRSSAFNKEAHWQRLPPQLSRCTQRLIPISSTQQPIFGLPWTGFLALDTQTGQLCRTTEIRLPDDKFQNLATCYWLDENEHPPVTVPKVEEDLPREVEYLKTYDAFVSRIEVFFDMPKSTLDLLWRFLPQAHQSCKAVDSPISKDRFQWSK
jgi:hypothetical protein